MNTKEKQAMLEEVAELAGWLDSKGWIQSPVDADKMVPQPIETLPDDGRPVYVWNPGAGCWQTWHAKRYGFLEITSCTHWLPRDVPPPLHELLEGEE